jgi:hypothetical protein
LPSYFVHSPQIWLLARDARDRATAAIQKEPKAYAVDAVTAFVLSASAAEGFINELAGICRLRLRDSALPAGVAAFAEMHEELERQSVGTLTKYLMASYTLSRAMFDKGKNPYQDFALLFRLRDLLMHLKAIDQEGPREGDLHTFTMPKLVMTFQQRKLARQSEGNQGMSWLAALQTGDMAAWACDTSLQMMLAVLNMIPDSASDPTAAFKASLRAHTEHG